MPDQEPTFRVHCGSRTFNLAAPTAEKAIEEAERTFRLNPRYRDVDNPGGDWDRYSRGSYLPQVQKLL